MIPAVQLGKTVKTTIELKNKITQNLLKSWKNEFIIVIFRPQNQLFVFPLFLWEKYVKYSSFFGVPTQIWNELSSTIEVSLCVKLY